MNCHEKGIFRHSGTRKPIDPDSRPDFLGHAKFFWCNGLNRFMKRKFGFFDAVASKNFEGPEEWTYE
jgi:hypothetical protein